MRALSHRRQGIPRAQALQWVLRAVTEVFWQSSAPICWPVSGRASARCLPTSRSSRWKKPGACSDTGLSTIGTNHDKLSARASYLCGTFPVLALFLFATLNRPLQSVTSACPGLGLMRIFTTQTGERFDPNAKTSASFDRFRRSSPECRTSLRQVHPFGRDQANFSPDSTIDLRPLAAAHRGKFALSQK